MPFFLFSTPYYAGLRPGEYYLAPESSYLLQARKTHGELTNQPGAGPCEAQRAIDLEQASRGQKRAP